MYTYIHISYTYSNMCLTPRVLLLFFLSIRLAMIYNPQFTHTLGNDVNDIRDNET